MTDKAEIMRLAILRVINSEIRYQEINSVSYQQVYALKFLKKLKKRLQIENMRAKRKI